MNRRLFLLATGGLSLASRRAGGGARTPAAQSAAETAAAGDVTRTLARYIVSAKPADLPASVRKEAARTVVNWMGAALGGCRHQTMENAIAALSPFSGPPQASILGRKERLDIMHAA